MHALRSVCAGWVHLVAYVRLGVPRRSRNISWRYVLAAARTLRGFDWSLSQINLNDSFTASILYNLPFGKGKKFGSDWHGATNAVLGNWQVTVIEKVTSGFPLFVVDSNNGFSMVGRELPVERSSLNRPDQVGDPQQRGSSANPDVTCHYLEGESTGMHRLAGPKIHTLQNWFNPCAFWMPRRVNWEMRSGADFRTTLCEH